MAATTVIEMAGATEKNTENVSDTKGVPIQRSKRVGKFQSQIKKKDLLKVEIKFLSVTFENPRLEKAFIVHDFRTLMPAFIRLPHPSIHALLDAISINSHTACSNPKPIPALGSLGNRSKYMFLLAGVMEVCVCVCVCVLTYSQPSSMPIL